LAQIDGARMNGVVMAVPTARERLPTDGIDGTRMNDVVMSVPTTRERLPTAGDETVRLLTAIWERQLQRSPIRPDENFFDLGGDSLLAITLFLEIGKATGRDLPITTIYEAPTIAELAATLERDAAPQFSPLVLMKAGDDDLPPVFIAHGLGGNVMEIFPLAKRVQSRQPIYAIQAKGVDGVGVPYERVEDMARFYLDAIRQVQPHGPYFLAGYSFGGLVVLEMAERLSEEGETIAFLGMLDTYPHPRFWPLACRIDVLARLAKRHAAALMDMAFGDVVPFLVKRFARLATYFGSRSVSSRNAATRRSPQPSLQLVFDYADVAWTQYRPRSYGGNVTFLRAEICLRFPENPLAMWGKLVRKLDVHTVPGDHLGMVKEQVDGLASRLSACLREAASPLELCGNSPERHQVGRTG
jgi:acetoacetyl-CoA synthetase